MSPLEYGFVLLAMAVIGVMGGIAVRDRRPILGTLSVTLSFLIGVLLGFLLFGIADSHAHDFAEALNSYGWGNSPEWLRIVCSSGRTVCWT